MVRQASIAPWRALRAGPARARMVFFPWRASRRRERSRFPFWWSGRSSVAVVEGLLTDVGAWCVPALLSVREAASASSSGPRTAGRALPQSTLMFLMADHACCGGYAASASRSGGAALFGGALDGVERSVLDGTWVGDPCLRESFLSSVIFEWLLGLGSL